MSALNLEAALCGTPVMLFPDERWTRAALERHDLGIPGLGWYREDDVEAVRARAATAYDNYLDSFAPTDGAVLAFADRCARHFVRAETEMAAAARAKAAGAS